MLADTAPRGRLHAHIARALLARTRLENHHHLLGERRLGQIHLQMEKCDWNPVHVRSTVTPGWSLRKVFQITVLQLSGSKL